MIAPNLVCAALCKHTNDTASVTHASQRSLKRPCEPVQVPDLAICAYLRRQAPLKAGAECVVVHSAMTDHVMWRELCIERQCIVQCQQQ